MALRGMVEGGHPVHDIFPKFMGVSENGSPAVHERNRSRTEDFCKNQRRAEARAVYAGFFGERNRVWKRQRATDYSLIEAPEFHPIGWDATQLYTRFRN